MNLLKERKMKTIKAFSIATLPEKMDRNRPVT
jgi:hypothetical protein